MAALIQAIIEALAQALLKQGVAGTGSLAAIRAFRMTCAAIIAAVATWVAVASALLWTSARVPGVQGLVHYVLTAGGPIWELALPACAVLLALLIVLPVPGKFSLGWVLSAAVTALAMGALAEFQGDGHSALNGFAVFSMLSTWPMTLLCLGLAWGEVPPLDAPPSRLALKYYRRRKHLVALRDYGRQRGLQISGPGGKGAALTLEGQYDTQHRVVITSSLQQAMSGASTYKVTVRMSSPRDILAYRISYDPLPKRASRPIFAGQASGPRGKPINYFLAPEHGEQLSQAFLMQMAEIVEAGRPFLGPRDFLTATPWGMQYTHISTKGLKVADAQLDPLLAWMRQLIAVLEPVSPGPRPTPAQPDPSPYGPYTPPAVGPSASRPPSAGYPSADSSRAPRQDVPPQPW